MARSRRKRTPPPAEFDAQRASRAAQKVFHWRRWLLIVTAVVLLATGVVKLRRQNGQSTLQIDLRRAAEVEHKAVEELRAARRRWNNGPH